MNKKRINSPSCKGGQAPPHLKQRKILIFLAMVLCLTVSPESFAGGQGAGDSCTIFQVDIANRLIWRGLSYTASPVMQGTVGYENDRFKAAAIGVYAVTPDEYHELDFLVEYRISPRFKIGVIDYFGLADTVGTRHDFFNFRNRDTHHMLDAWISYKHSDRFPLEAMLSCFVYGPDKDPVNGKNRFSTYGEVLYTFYSGTREIIPFIGFSTAKGFYADGFAVVNTGLKFKTSFNPGGKIELPAEISLIGNPYDSNFYISCMIGIK